MIVGPGEGDRYLARVLRMAHTWADHIVVVADHADIATLAVLRQAINDWPPVTITFEYGDATFLADESEIRNQLFATCDDVLSPGDLIVVLDADEVLRGPYLSVRTVLERLAADPRNARAWSARFLHLWTPDGSAYRTDGGWAPAMQDRIYLHEKGLRVEPRQLACRAIPERVQPRAESVLEVLHWGYARPEDREAKYDRYMSIDGGKFHALWHLESILREPLLAPV
jgi:hypothetical protein